MIEQIGVALPFTAFYTTLGLGTTGLTVTVDVYRNSTEVVAAGACTDEGDGLYTYTLDASFNTVEGVYKAVFKTATTTVDQQHLPAAWYVGKAGVENLDAPISVVDTVVDAIKAKTDNLPTDPADESLLEAAIAAIPSAPTAAVVADAVWDEALSGHVTAGTTGKKLADLSSGGSGAILETVTVTVSSLPRDGVEVWVTTDEAGLNLVASGVTDALGEVDFMLDAGTYYVWKQLAGVNFTNPQTMVVS